MTKQNCIICKLIYNVYKKKWTKNVFICKNFEIFDCSDKFCKTKFRNFCRYLLKMKKILLHNKFRDLKISRLKNLRNLEYIIQLINDDFFVFANKFEKFANNFKSAKQSQNREKNKQFIVKIKKRRHDNRDICRIVFTCN